MHYVIIKLTYGGVFMYLGIALIVVSLIYSILISIGITTIYGKTEENIQE